MGSLIPDEYWKLYQEIINYKARTVTTGTMEALIFFYASLVYGGQDYRGVVEATNNIRWNIHNWFSSWFVVACIGNWRDTA